MKKSSEYEFSVGLFSVALILFGISIVMGLIPGLVFSMDKICMFLGFSVFGSGLVFLKKSKDN